MISLNDLAIFDRIVRFAERKALLAVRATCTTLRDRADADLFKHIIVTGATRPILHAPHGRLPLNWEHASTAERTLWSRRLAHARILDCHTKLDIAQVDPDLASALSHVEVVRRFEPTAPALPARKLVDFAFLTPSEGLHAHADSSISSPCLCASTFTFDIPEGTCTSVTNVFYDPVRVPIHSFLQLGHGPDTAHSVIIYTARAERSSGKSSPTPSCGKDEIPPLGMLCHLVEELALRIGNSITAGSSGHHTLVGIDEIDHSLLAMAPAASDDDIRQAIISAIQEECSVFFPQVVAQLVPAAISFVSRDDYATQLGWDAFELESMV
jgi:hypothetical protein